MAKGNLIYFIRVNEQFYKISIPTSSSELRR